MTWRPRSVLNRTTPWAQRCSAPPQETWTTDSEPAGYSASRTQPLLDDPSGSSRSGSHARSLIGERDRKSTRLNSRSRGHLVCRLLPEQKKQLDSNAEAERAQQWTETAGAQLAYSCSTASAILACCSSR